MRRDHQLKRRAAQRKLNAIASWEVKESQGNGSKPEAPSRDELLHLQIFKNIELVLRANEKESDQRVAMLLGDLQKRVQLLAQRIMKLQVIKGKMDKKELKNRLEQQ